MPFFTRTGARLGTAVAAAAGLVAAGTAGAHATPRKATPYERPYIDVKITGKNLVAHTGGGAFATGQMDLSLEAVGGERTLAVVMFASNYSFKAFRDDLRTFGQSFDQNGQPSNKGLKALNHAINHTTGYGGIDAPEGKTRRATLLLPDEGRYVLYDDSHNLPRHPTPVDISGTVGPQHLQQFGGTVTTKTNRRFGGDDVLPNKGNIKVVNKSTQSPHFLVLQHVKEGTTKKQVLQAFQSNSRPSWLRNGQAGTDVLSYGQKQTLHVNLPAGQYVEMCFFPDPEEGQPHAFMGMLRMVHLK